MNNLRNLRKAKGYSIEQLHKMTGIPRRTLEEWDAERRQIQYYHRMKILAELFHCDIDELMTKQEDCMWGEDPATVCLQQGETGVRTFLFLDDYDIFLDIIISREEALALLDSLKTHKDIRPFLEKYRK